MSQIRIARGSLRRVELGDLPDNTYLFDKLDVLDFAIRWELSPELSNGQTAVRYLDCLIWMKPNVGFATSDVVDLSQTWNDQIVNTAQLEQWVNVATKMDIAEYGTSINAKIPPSISKSKYEDDQVNRIVEHDDAVTYDYTVDAVRLFVPDGSSVKSSYVVEVVSDRTCMRLLGLDNWVPVQGGRLAPLPRETMSQGSLSVCKVREPLTKVGPDGWKIIVTGNLSGCSAILIISDEFDVSDWDTRHRILRELNYKWSTVYENAALSKDTFKALCLTTGFELRRKFYGLTQERLSALLTKACDLELNGWKYPSIKFNPVRHMDLLTEEFPKMRLSELSLEQRQEIETNLVNYIPTVDWPEEGEEVMLPTPFGDVELTYEEWQSILNGFDAG